MFYVIRKSNARHTLIECKSVKELETLRRAGDEEYTPVSPPYARQWVKNGRQHETGLYSDDGKLRYAKADPDGY